MESQNARRNGAELAFGPAIRVYRLRTNTTHNSIRIFCLRKRAREVGATPGPNRQVTRQRIEQAIRKRLLESLSTTAREKLQANPQTSQSFSIVPGLGFPNAKRVRVNRKRAVSPVFLISDCKKHRPSSLILPSQDSINWVGVTVVFS